MTDKTLAERLRDILADCVEGRSFVDAIALVDDLAVEAADALDAKDAEIARLKGALTEIAEPMRDQRTLTPTHVFVDRLIWIQDRARAALGK